MRTYQESGVASGIADALVEIVRRLAANAKLITFFMKPSVFREGVRYLRDMFTLYRQSADLDEVVGKINANSQPWLLYSLT